jgi:hypothetical protein
MKEPKGPIPAERIDVELALAFLAGTAMIATSSRELGRNTNQSLLQEVQDKLLNDLKRQYERKIRARALRRRRDWRKADVNPLVTLFLIPAVGRKAAYRRIGLLIEAKGKLGKGVVMAKPFDEALRDGLNVCYRMVNPATSAAARPLSPWYARLIRAAYEGELRAERAARQNSSDNYPRINASEIAEDQVAKAAGISRAAVHQLCQRARDEGRGGADDLNPPTAKELKRHLTSVPKLA